MMKLSALHARLARIREARESGITLAELMVTMVILSVIMVLVVGFFFSANRAFTLNRTVDGNTRSASNAMNEASRMLRAATANPVSSTVTNPAFVSATSTSVVFYAYINLSASTELPVEVRFTINPTTNALLEAQWPATAQAGGLWSFPNPTSATPTFTRTIAGPILPVAAGGPVLFTYFDSAGTAIPLTNSAVPAASLKLIASVQVALTLGTSTSNGQSVSLINTIGLPNLGIARTQ
jgi:type II secretory pathway pseudopilin PulG